jgi:hypothetical protein
LQFLRSKTLRVTPISKTFSHVSWNTFCRLEVNTFCCGADPYAHHVVTGAFCPTGVLRTGEYHPISASVRPRYWALGWEAQPHLHHRRSRAPPMALYLGLAVEVATCPVLATVQHVLSASFALI